MLAARKGDKKDMFAAAVEGENVQDNKRLVFGVLQKTTKNYFRFIYAMEILEMIEKEGFKGRDIYGYKFTNYSKLIYVYTASTKTNKTNIKKK